jgi:hypothetical protein
MRKANKLGMVQGPSMDLFAVNEYMVDHSADLLAYRAERKAAGEHRSFWHVGAFPAHIFAGAPLPLP